MNFPNIQVSCDNYPPTRHIKYKRIAFAPRNNSIMANMVL